MSRIVLGLIWLAATAMISSGCGRADSLPPPGDVVAGKTELAMDEATSRWWFFFEELEVEQLLHRLSLQHGPRRLAFINASVVSMNGERVLSGQTIVVDSGKIVALGPSGTIATASRASQRPAIERPAIETIDLGGAHIMPGLTDMHVHNLVSSSQHLLNLAHGITTVRDMGGFPWLLRVRARIERNQLLAPTIYVAGHILNSRPMGMYATVVSTPEQARAVVREQHQLGYDFIKVHNRAEPPIYDAILDEARRLSIDVVGHIPHRIPIAKAVAGAHRTFEHFKGYIQDWDLQLTGEDYVAATNGAEVWNCPTFYTYRQHLRGDAARRLVGKSPEMSYVPARDRAAWLALADEAPSAIHQNIRPLSEKIFQTLRPVEAHFVAGTDSGGGYPYMVPGLALHEELRIMHSVGMSPYEALQTATTEAAKAMRRESKFGTIAVGQRADLIVLAGNPLADLGSLESIQGVVARGIWLPKPVLDAALAKLGTIYAATKPPWPGSRPSTEDVNRLIDGMHTLHVDGFVFRDHDLAELVSLLRDEGHAEQAARVLCWKEPTSCSTGATGE